MLKVLFYGESCLNPTGFGQVNKHIAAALARVAEVTYVASSHYVVGEDAFPYTLIPCRDPDEPRNLAEILARVKAAEWDVFFYQGDVGANNDVLEAVKAETDRDPRKESIFYMPIDTDVANAGAFIPWSWATVPATYT